MNRLCLVLPVCLILCGCLTYQKYSFKFDYTTGKEERRYCDIRSQDGKGEKNYSIEADWELLQARVGKEFGKEFDPDVIKPVKAELFEDGDVLSGKETFEVQLPKAFPSKKAILERIHADQDEKPEFQIINSEIFLFAG